MAWYAGVLRVEFPKMFSVEKWNVYYKTETTMFPVVSTKIRLTFTLASNTYRHTF